MPPSRGGITGALRVAHLADALQRNAEVHGEGPANVHLCLAIRNTSYYEVLIRSNPIGAYPEIDRAGHVHAPPHPGVGFDVDADDLARRAVARL